MLKMAIFLFTLLPVFALGDTADKHDNIPSGEYNLVSKGLERSYLLHIPANLRPKAPLVIVMHGYTGSAKTIMSYVGMNQVADEQGFVVAYPQGTIDKQGNAFFNVGYEFHRDSTVDDIHFIRDLVLALQGQFNLDLDRTFATGMSNYFRPRSNYGAPHAWETFKARGETQTSTAPKQFLSESQSASK